MPSSSDDRLWSPEWGGRVAMEAGPHDTDQQRRDAVAGAPGLSPDGPDASDEPDVLAGGAEVEVELRPARRIRIWQLAPIVILAVTGSLMFGFPLAFGTGGSGPVVAMLGLLIGCCAAGWGVMAARRVGHTWPGLPPRGSGERPDWRVLLLYAGMGAALVALAVWRVARLR
ncbi:transmembrane protein [Streptomyces clavuligerus]|nr:transmembrane protein [Streptomyces clavuligerus]